MRRLLPAFFVVAALLTRPAVAAVPPPESRTLFFHAETAWAVGTIALSKPLPFRDGKILVFPSQITDLLWAPDGTKPRSLMLVYEVLSDDKDKPYFEQGDQIFAPIQLLSDHAYWKDNLPNTRRHAIAGGRAYAFRGEQALEAREILAAYLKAHDLKGLERWSGQVAAVAAALGSTIQVIREDAVTYLAIYPTLNRDFSDAAVAPIRAFLSSEAATTEKTRLVDALVAAKLSAIPPMLQELAKRDDATGAVAWAGLEKLGQGPSTEQLLVMSRSASPEMQAFAAGVLGSRAATDTVAFDRSSELLTGGSTNAVVSALMDGLVRAGGDKVVTILAAVVERGESGSRKAAQALGQIGGPAAEAALTRILKEKQGEAAQAATVGLGTMKNCKGCTTLLHEQHESHADPAVRNLAGVVLGVPLEHKH